MVSKPLLHVENLKTHFFTSDGVVRAIDNISYDVYPGEILGLVGESGSGKSVSALSIMRLIPEPAGKIISGEILFKGENLLEVDDSRMRAIRGNNIAMVFQEPMTSLNPVLTIGRQITESLELHLNMTNSQSRSRAIDLLEMVGIATPTERLNDYPHQFSGGMQQRIMIAIALSCSPDLLLADEPTTSLDVTIQAQVLEVIVNLSKELETAIILITHNLGVIARYADRVNVMYAGRIVESGPSEEIYRRPQHAYTLGLLESVPRLNSPTKRLVPIEGTPPDLLNLPIGCAFEPRCRFATNRCRQEKPYLKELTPGHSAACWNSEEVATAVTKTAPNPEEFSSNH